MCKSGSEAPVCGAAVLLMHLCVCVRARARISVFLLWFNFALLCPLKRSKWTQAPAFCCLTYAQGEVKRKCVCTHLVLISFPLLVKEQREGFIISAVVCQLVSRWKATSLATAHEGLSLHVSARSHFWPTKWRLFLPVDSLTCYTMHLDAPFHM